MALINCSECGHEISDKALRCPNCGCPIERVETIQEAIEVKEPKKSKTWIWGIFAFLLCIIGVGCYFYFNNYSHEEDNIGLENDFAQKIKGKYTIVVWNDNFGEFYNTEGGRLCSFELSDGRKEPMTLRLSQSLNILGKSTDRLYLSSNRLFADYSDYLNFNSSYNPNKELGVAVECSNEDDATFYFVKIGKGQIEEKHITLHQVKPKAGTDYVLLYYNDEYGTLYDRNGKRICGVSRGYSSAGDLHVKFTKTISFYNSTTNELLIKDNYVYLSSSDLIDDKYRKEGEPTTRKASSKIVDENDAVIYEFFKIDADTERAEIEQSEEKNISTDFISGGNTYVGTKVNDVETSYDHGDVKKGDIVRYETHYTIKCFKDGTMTWTESLTENNGEPDNKNFEGEWKKVTISKHDVIYTWYEFWATTYDIHATPHYSRIGFIDEKGQLYFEGADPEREIPENSRTFVECTVTAQ